MGNYSGTVQGRTGGRERGRLALRKAKQIQIMPTNLLTAPQSLLQYCARVAAAAVPGRGGKEREGRREGERGGTAAAASAGQKVTSKGCSKCPKLSNVRQTLTVA